MAAIVEYEVRQEYQDYTVDQLLESPVTIFQGVGDTQSELLERYFSVHTVKDLANMPSFLNALGVQQLVLEGGASLESTVDAVAQDRQLGFALRARDQNKKVKELPAAPVHVLEGVTPGQDLAFYDAFRITSVTHLAQNRIMLEARVIDYLAQSGGGGEAASSEAVASILGSRDVSQRARDRAGEHVMDGLSGGGVGAHVRDRLDAMRSRAQQPSDVRPLTAGGGTADRLAAIRAGRGETTGARSGSGATVTASRAEQIIASRGTQGASGGGASSVLASRADAGSGASRAEMLASARGGSAARVTATSTGAPRGATVKSRTPTADAAKAEQAKKAAADAAATEVNTLPTEADMLAESRAPRRRRNAGPPPAVLAGAAAVFLIVVGVLIWALWPSPQPAGPSEAEVAAANAAATEAAAAQAAATEAATQAATPAPPPRIQGTHTVKRGDTLWDISAQEYRDPLNWPSIYEENRGEIRHPDLVYPSQEFRIPSKPEQRYPEYPKGYRRAR